MTALGDLTDVDLTGAAEGDRLAYDAAASLWKPLGWREYTGTFSYAAGLTDYGSVTWTQAADADVTHIENLTGSALVTADALVATFTVTAAMLSSSPAGFSDFVVDGAVVGLHTGTMGLSTTRSIRAAVAVNGVYFSDSAIIQTATTGTRRMAWAWLLPLSVGDVVTVYAVIGTLGGTDTVPLSEVTAIPCPWGFGTADADRGYLSWLSSTPLPTGVSSSPTGWVGTNIGATTTSWGSRRPQVGGGYAQTFNDPLGASIEAPWSALGYAPAETFGELSGTDTARIGLPRRPSTVTVYGLPIPQLPS